MVRAFNAVNTTDYNQVQQLQRENTQENYPQIFELSKRIRYRQTQLRPFLADNNRLFKGKLSALQIYPIDDVVVEAKSGSAEYNYTQALQALNRSRNNPNDRISARQAHDFFDEVNRYFNSYKDTRTLQQEAYTRGLNHVYFSVQNDSRTVIPQDFEKALQSLFVRDLNSKWVKYHTTREQGLRYEYSIVNRITDINISPELVNNNRFEETKSVEDGFDYTYDEKGNVKKDANGNDIKTPRYRNVRAYVTETLQSKDGQVRGTLEYIDNRTGERLVNVPLNSNAAFRNRAMTFEGDRRALKQETLNALGNQPKPFPSTEAMLLLAAEDMKRNAKQIVSDNARVVEK